MKTQNTTRPYQVVMASDDFGGEEFNYDTMKEAYEGISRLATKAAELNDGIERNFYLSEASNP